MDDAARTAIARSIEGCPRLHVGCGFNFVRGWVNVGLFEESFLGYGCVTENNGLVLHADLTRDFPFADGTLEEVYASHFIEHFTFTEGLSLLRAFHRALRPGGVIRLTFPDLELWVRKYSEDDIAFFEKYRAFFANDPRQHVKTKGEVFMSQLHGWGHRWGYDYESARHLLDLAGFSRVGRKAAFDSAIADIRKLESSFEGRLMETCYVEAVREG
jgi:predicted SAM-dependent methyltransferase